MSDNYLKTYADKSYRYPTLVTHKGTVLSFAMDDKRRIYYTVLDLNDAESRVLWTPIIGRPIPVR
ncbi:MAG: hypothetical protein M3347_07750 [Armatimonadota bacterium]|nr:hypothetical protein [Armatimonadota bacterium]